MDRSEAAFGGARRAATFPVRFEQVPSDRGRARPDLPQPYERETEYRVADRDVETERHEIRLMQEQLAMLQRQFMNRHGDASDRYDGARRERGAQIPPRPPTLPYDKPYLPAQQIINAGGGYDFDYGGNQPPEIIPAWPTDATRPRTHRPSIKRELLRARYGYDEAEADVEEKPENEEDAFSFRLSRRKESVLSLDISEPRAESAHPSDGKTAGSIETTLPANCTLYNVFTSQYTGSYSLGGAQKVELTVMPDPKKGGPIFRWVHVEDAGMVLDDFQRSVTGLSGLLEEERTSLTKLFTRVRANSKSTSRFLEPAFLRVGTPSGGVQKGNGHEASHCVTWMCIPYFCLEPYSDTLHPSKVASAHPMRTLHQARVASARKAQDMQQAVCNLPGTPREHCFHIAQAWAVILDDKLLVTCARISVSALHGDVMDILSRPTSDAPQRGTQRVLVYYGDARIWAFSADQCRTWFALLQKFAEIWPTTFQLLHNNKPVTAELWPRILSIAEHKGIDVRLKFVRAGPDKQVVRGILRNHLQATEAEKPQKTVQQGAGEDKRSKTASEAHHDKHEPPQDDISPNQFAVFTWLNTTKAQDSADPAAVNKEQLLADLAEMDKYLRSQNAFGGQSWARQSSAQQSRTDVISALEQEMVQLSTLANGKSSLYQESQALVSLKVDVFNAAESVFEFFLPLSLRGPTIDRFWSDLYEILKLQPPPDQADDSSRQPDRTLSATSRIQGDFTFLDNVYQSLDELSRVSRPFSELLTQMPQEEHGEINLPDGFVSAWLHIVTAIACIANDSYWSEHHTNEAYRLLIEGMANYMQDLTQQTLLQSAVVAPLDIGLLVTLRLLGDLTGPNKDISESYADYLEVLEAKIKSNPLQREHQDKISRLKQEILVIRKTLQSQRVALDSLVDRDSELPGRTIYPDVDKAVRKHSHIRLRSHETYAAGGEAYSPADKKMSALDSVRVRDLFLHSCLELIETRTEDFSEMEDQAQDLERANLQSIDSNKDRQDSAIYTFTVVTIIFLPLSTVAGILGMNTNDVRNMNFNQWVFWATALPLTFVVIFLSLLWAGELDNFIAGLRSLWPRWSIARPYESKDDDEYSYYSHESSSNDGKLEGRHASYGKSAIDADRRRRSRPIERERERAPMRSAGFEQYTATSRRRQASAWAGSDPKYVVQPIYAQKTRRSYIRTSDEEYD